MTQRQPANATAESPYPDPTRIDLGDGWQIVIARPGTVGQRWSLQGPGGVRRTLSETDFRLLMQLAELVG
jgi:hypothetical protein